MKNYCPLSIQDLDLSLMGLRVIGLRLNAETPESFTDIHDHPHDQIFVFLEGQGALSIGRSKYHGRPGGVFFARRGEAHGFDKNTAARGGLCMVFDLFFPDGDADGLALNGNGSPPAEPHLPIVNALLTSSALARCKERVSRLYRLEDPGGDAFQSGAVILDVLGLVLRANGWLRSGRRGLNLGLQARSRMVERALSRPGADDVPLGEVASRLGYQRDHLNRLLKAECGLTLGQLRSRLKVKRAIAFLRQGSSVADVGKMVGIADQNYFSRWFKQQTGVTPTSWRRNPRPFEIFEG